MLLWTLERSPRLTALTYSDDESPANPFWVNAVQTLTFCNVLAILACFALFHPNDRQTYLGFIVFLTAFSLPLGWVFWKLSARPEARTIKRAVAIAFSWALLVLIPSLMLIWIAAKETDSVWTTANVAIIATVQAALILASIKTYLSMKREGSDVRMLLPPLAAAFLVLTGLLILVARFGRVTRRASEGGCYMDWHAAPLNTRCASNSEEMSNGL